jgi:phosphate/sulfate permease
VSQIVVGWVVAPAGAAAVAAALFASMKFFVLERPEPFMRAFRAIPLYLAFTATVLALFLMLEVPRAAALERLGTGGVVAVVVAAFMGALVVSCVFFVPYLWRSLVRKDARVKVYHVLLGPLLLLENVTPFMFFPGNPNDELVQNYYDYSPAVCFQHSPGSDPDKGRCLLANILANQKRAKHHPAGR